MNSQYIDKIQKQKIWLLQLLHLSKTLPPVTEESPAGMIAWASFSSECVLSSHSSVLSCSRAEHEKWVTAQQSKAPPLPLSNSQRHFCFAHNFGLCIWTCSCLVENPQENLVTTAEIPLQQNVLYTVHSIHCSLCTFHALYIVYIPYTVHCVHCSLCSVHIWTGPTPTCWLIHLQCRSMNKGGDWNSLVTNLQIFNDANLLKKCQTATATMQN